jgi:hypothetical protein
MYSNLPAMLVSDRGRHVMAFALNYLSRSLLGIYAVRILMREVE